MRDGIFHHASHWRPAKSLAALGGLSHTFGGLACFLAGIFLCWGIYILEDAFAHPVDAQAVALIAAAFAIALALLLLFYLFKPRWDSKTTHHQNSRDSTALAELPLFRGPSRSARRDDLRKDLAYQRVYIDPSRIRA
jgi:hypothetical protein